MASRIGLSMRIVWAEGYDEPRDALAQQWSEFMVATFADVAWLPLPNLGSGIEAHLHRWGVDGLILTGGNSIGDAPLRDETESRLIEFALREGIPVFGVCRGLQMLQHHFGGRIDPCKPEEHVGTRHTVEIVDAAMPGREIDVNSYHEQGVRDEALAPQLVAVARTADGWVEAVRHADAPIAGVMWHPERELPYRAHDLRFMRRVLGREDGPSRQ